MLFKRKEFLQVGSLATASVMLPKFLKAFDGKVMVPPGNKVLVVLQFSGGNDGLNTVIPVEMISIINRGQSWELKKIKPCYLLMKLVLILRCRHLKNCLMKEAWAL